MAKIVTNNCLVACSFGTAPAKLRVTSPHSFYIGNEKAATVADCMPNVNIPSFTLCTCPTNPAVVAAQGAPQPCVPPAPFAWSSAAKSVTANGMPVLLKTSTTICAYSGRITCQTASNVDAE